MIILWHISILYVFLNLLKFYMHYRNVNSSNDPKAQSRTNIEGDCNAVCRFSNDSVLHESSHPKSKSYISLRIIKQQSNFYLMIQSYFTCTILISNKTLFKGKHSTGALDWSFHSSRCCWIGVPQLWKAIKWMVRII